MKQASPDEVMLYTRMGEALCQIQLLEQALSHCLTIKLNPELSETDAKIFLSKQQNSTFGTVVKLAVKKQVYTSTIQNALDELLIERNWLVHHAMRDSQEEIRIVVKEPILLRVKAMRDRAEKLQTVLEWDLIEFAQSKGRNMSGSIELMKREKGEKPTEF